MFGEKSIVQSDFDGEAKNIVERFCRTIVGFRNIYETRTRRISPHAEHPSPLPFRYIGKVRLK